MRARYRTRRVARSKSWSHPTALHFPRPRTTLPQKGDVRRLCLPAKQGFARLSHSLQQSRSETAKSIAQHRSIGAGHYHGSMQCDASLKRPSSSSEKRTACAEWWLKIGATAEAERFSFCLFLPRPWRTSWRAPTRGPRRGSNARVCPTRQRPAQCEDGGTRISAAMQRHFHGAP